MDVLGYADRFSARAGERLQVMVGCARERYQAEVVRLDRAYPLGGQGWNPTVIDAPCNGDHPGRAQPIHAGSYVTVPGSGLDFAAGLSLQCHLYPTLPARGREQGIVGRWAGGRGFLLGLDAEGRLFWRIGDGASRTTITAPAPLAAKRWYAVTAQVDPATGQGALFWDELRRNWVHGTLSGGDTQPGVYAEPDPATPLLLGAATMDDGHAVCHLNGKVDRPHLWHRALTDEEFVAFGGGMPAGEIPGLIAEWDPTIDHVGRTLVDVSGNGRHGTLVNLPARLVTGANWTGEQTAFHTVPEQYGAIHFHEDDLEDAGWEPDFAYDVPADLPGGVYAVRLTAGETTDHVPFYVRPAAGANTADILYLAPTNTYLAYGNEKLFKGLETEPGMFERMTSHEITLNRIDEYLRDHQELAASCYDLHEDGSGFMYSSRLRPLLTIRPDFVTWMTGELRHFSSDLYLVEWMGQQGFAFDVATDEDVHMEGINALSPYSVVVTGGHPEYWSVEMLDSLEAYLAGGGRLMYLGGNGFYWVTGMDRSNPHVIEVRRGYSGTKSWESAPGEGHLAFTGQPGGLWRYRGRNPNTLTGIGFAAQGWGSAASYSRLPDSDDPRASWIFAGIGRDETIGDFGHMGGGAAGDEIDRFDPAFGSPDETLYLATSQGRQSDYYQLVIEDSPFMLPQMGGQSEPRVRSDITLLETEQGGAVFAAGSIAWNAALTWNGGDNNVSRLTGNVLRRFARRAPLQA